MASTSKHFIGVYLNEECHKTIYSSQIGSKHIDMFAEENQLLIKLKSGIDQPPTDICNPCEKYFLVKMLHSNTSVVNHSWCVKIMKR